MSADTAPVVAPGLYRLRNVGSGLLLEVDGSAKGSGANVQQGADKQDGAGGRHWQLSPVHEGAALYHLTNAHSGKRLDVANASTENGANVQQWKANNYGAQEWLIEQHLDAPGTVTLVSFISGLVLEVADGSTADGANVQQWEDTDSPGQWWQLEPVPGTPQ
ncbi:RICIN domain-containing protein [Streptomyces sp. NPDC048496]|uniref:RICIN domain-containing protein n=1 Tax=Streptomyces sp. NPDC048496 TaxID=3365558 RepID=UPI003710981A